MTKQVRYEDRKALNRSLVDACKCARRLSRCASSEAHDAALTFIRALRAAGADDTDAD